MCQKQSIKQGLQNRRKILALAMGGKCEYCGSVDELEFHHLVPRYWVATSVNQQTRQKNYEQEFLDGKLKLACATCNKRLGKPELEAREEVPF